MTWRKGRCMVGVRACGCMKGEVWVYERGGVGV